LYIDTEFNNKLLVDYKDNIDNALNKVMSLKKVKKFSIKFTESRIQAYIESIEEELNSLDRNNPKDARKIALREQKIANVRAGIYSNKVERALVEPINLNSNKTLGQLMYLADYGFKFPVLKYTSDKNGKETTTPSTDEETLVKLRLTIKDPESPKAIFLDKLLELRGLDKMYKTYILGWNEKTQDDNRLHGRINIIGTDSNRYSSAEPNLQQIPKTSVDPNIKKQLIAPPGMLYIACDYSQAELRMMAHLSGDETYLQAFREGMDPHLAIAATKYHVPYEEALKIHEDENHPDHKLWKTRRKQAKQIAFGLIYGIGAGLLAEKLSDPKAGLIVSKQEAEQMMSDFFSQHPKIKKFKDKQEKFLRKHGYYTQLFGTKRRLPEIWEGDKQEQAYALRLGLNFPCQGAAANMTNFGAVLVYWAMRQGKFPRMWECCTVHDAIYQYAYPEDINVWTVSEIWEILRNPKTKQYFGFQINDVNMDMDFSIGRSMAEELPFIPGYDYKKMLEPDFSVEAYMEEYNKYKHINTKDFSKIYAKEINYHKQLFKKHHDIW
jgi:DNA polymerase I-like protein with 3'-5' exonuclease and polymerase domains